MTASVIAAIELASFIRGIAEAAILAGREELTEQEMALIESQRVISDAAYNAKLAEIRAKMQPGGNP